MDQSLKLFDVFTFYDFIGNGYPSFGLLYTRYFC